MRPLHCLLLCFSLLFIASCGKPKEISYLKLDLENERLVDPDTKKPFTGIARDHHKNGQLRIEFPCKDGLFHGTVKEWWENGKPKAETEFVRGLRTGRNMEYTEAGLPWQERIYKDDKIVSEKKFESGK